MSSWRTTVAALVLAFAGILNAAGALLDDDPTTNPNWTIVMADLGAAWGFLVARDNAVTSEKAGAK